MFSQLGTHDLGRQRRLVGVSAALHFLLLVWILYPPEPLLLNPYSVRIGRNGTSVTRLYWPGRLHDQAKGSSPDSATQVYRHERYVRQQLVWQNVPLAKLLPRSPVLPSEAKAMSPASTISNGGHGAPAGLPYGTLGRGPAFGDEMRPALPITTSDPIVYPWQLPDQPGNEVIEITIDERGEIVREVVLHSLGPDIDTKCLAALQNWHFHPATHNGVAIASKQDAIFPFRARG
jgi:hypothetical protein